MSLKVKNYLVLSIMIVHQNQVVIYVSTISKISTLLHKSTMCSLEEVTFLAKMTPEYNLRLPEVIPKLRLGTAPFKCKQASALQILANAQ